MALDFFKLIKFIIFFALTAFILSFFLGLINGVSFLVILLRSFIFTVIFSLLGVSVFFINEFFLKVDFMESENRRKTKKMKSGETIDIVSSDELDDMIAVDYGKVDSDSKNEDLNSSSSHSAESGLDGSENSFEDIDLDLGTDDSGDLSSSHRKPKFGDDVSLEDIGGADSTPHDYAKVVRTMIMKDE